MNKTETALGRPHRMHQIAVAKLLFAQAVGIDRRRLLFFAQILWGKFS